MGDRRIEWRRPRRIGFKGCQVKIKKGVGKGEKIEDNGRRGVKRGEEGEG